ncbi:uncharacterized protein BDR25DRAFT_357401 [Lindgomyces ingoldianus]|uniref:Uncharacterized protein n=1 Tax=Lindgomyces ingoldianus TaxID=673940 RepID=A0ACB6QPL5_9PLEO|nr:uncharacterized protein BDR25DRAFT_357401 [Lindgomyces ingoldianus]KAF2468475.1 hypothetical protein BDR25DRAFT_357401 [Lindgomyces ingoldianus]
MEFKMSNGIAIVHQPVLLMYLLENQAYADDCERQGASKPNYTVLSCRSTVTHQAGDVTPGNVLATLVPFEREITSTTRSPTSGSKRYLSQQPLCLSTAPYSFTKNHLARAKTYVPGPSLSTIRSLQRMKSATLLRTVAPLNRVQRRHITTSNLFLWPKTCFSQHHCQLKFPSIPTTVPSLKLKRKNITHVHRPLLNYELQVYIHLYIFWNLSVDLENIMLASFCEYKQGSRTPLSYLTTTGQACEM